MQGKVFVGRWRRRNALASRAARRHPRGPKRDYFFFAGRLALNDVLELGPAFESGEVVGPAYLPPWARDVDRLAAYLAFASIVNRIDLRAIDLDEFLARGSE